MFCAVVEANGFAGAEIILGKSKSAISMDITALETRFGMTVCKRGRAGFSLTDAGTDLFQATQQLFNAQEKFRDEVGIISKSPYSKLSVAFDDSLLYSARDELAGFVSIFRSQYPETHLTFSTSAPTLTTNSVIEGRAEIGICVAPRVVSELEQVRLFDEELDLYCGETHPLFELPAKDITLKVLTQYEFADVAVRQNPTVGKFLDSVPVKSSANMPSRLIFITSGLFLGFLPMAFADRWVTGGKLRCLSHLGLRYDNSVYALTRREHLENETVKFAWEELIGSFA